nr:hypothetical protein [uncultured Albidiferax sp.]
MQFTESVRTCFSQYASFGGRASRPELIGWLVMLYWLVQPSENTVRY